MYRKNSIGNLVLLALEKSIDGYVKFEDFVYHPPGFYDYRMGQEPKKSELARVLKRLREKGLVDFIETGELVIRLTDQGREKAILSKMFLNEEKWDGKWRIVIFDIPEKRRVVRDVLRNKLKNWGFVPRQKSVWVSKKNCTNELRQFIQKIGIKDWVIVIESDNADL